VLKVFKLSDEEYTAHVGVCLKDLMLYALLFLMFKRIQKQNHRTQTTNEHVDGSTGAAIQ
jgi:hypothetical protein